MPETVGWGLAIYVFVVAFCAAWGWGIGGFLLSLILSIRVKDNPKP